MSSQKICINVMMLDIFKGKIDDRKLPITIEEGEDIKDGNGDVIKELLIDSPDEKFVNDVLSECCNEMIELI